MRTMLRGAASTAWAAAVVAGVAGLIEGVTLGVIYDPFGAGWAARGASIATFVSAYLAAGWLAGALVGLPLQWIRLRGASPPVACGLIGTFYFRGWCHALNETPGLIHPPSAVMVLSGAILFGIGGAIAAKLEPRKWVGMSMAAAGAGVAGLFLLVTQLPSAAPVEAAARADTGAGSERRQPAELSSPARHVLFIVADTLRADHMSLYGYPRATSPELERLARTGVVFTNAIAQKTKTSPSVASLLTGTYPHTHGIVNCGTRLPDKAVTLAETLRDQGFATHSIVANGNIGAAFNFGQGFESIDEIWADPNHSDASGVADHALRWLEDRQGTGATRPFFLYVHFIDPHAPYAPPPPWADRFVDDALYGRLSHVKVAAGEDAIGGIRPFVRLPERSTDVDYYVARYDAEIAYLDHHIGRLLEGMRRMGLERDTLVIFTSDHGESLFEHEVFFSHGGFTYDDTARVPLVIALPGRLQAATIVEEVVQTAALAPTALHAVGLRPPAEMELPGFWELAAGRRPNPAEKAEPAAFVEGDTVPSTLRTAIRTGRWKMIENPTGFDRTPGRFELSTVMNMNQKQKALELVVTGREFLSRFELYDIMADPGETLNLAGRDPEMESRLLARLREWRAAGAGHERLRPSPAADLPDEILKNLRSLGYVQ